MIVPYSPDDSAAFYEDYYSAQVGEGVSIPVYRGKAVMNGNGIGSIFSGLMRSAMPMLKRGALSAGKKLLSSGVGVLSDVASGKSFSQSAKSRLKSTGMDILGDAKDQILGGISGTGSRKRKTKTGGRKTKKRWRTKNIPSILD